MGWLRQRARPCRARWQVGPGRQHFSKSVSPGEHQVAFSPSATLKFDPTLPYGYRPKVTLLWKLGVHGPWDSWRDICIPIVDGRCNPGKLAHPPNVCIRPETADAAAIERTVVSNHSVYRLPDQAAGGSGHGLLTAGEGKLGQRLRGRSRELGIANKIAEMDAKVLSTRPAGPFVKPLFFNVVSMESMRRECLLAKPAGVERRVTSPKPNSAQVHCLQRDALVLMARARLPLPLISITDKVHSPAYATPAGASVRHYTNLPLYDWRVSELVNLSHQCKARDSGFVRCDGHVRPGGTIWGPGSEAFDRTRSYELHSNLTLMALAHFYTGDELFAAKGVELARAWWLDEDTAMLPTLEFAHYSRPRGGRYFGVIEMKDLVWTLDAVALLRRTSSWTANDSRRMDSWCRAYGVWLNGSKERASRNNHGWYFAIQRASVAHCAGDTRSSIGVALGAHVDTYTTAKYITAAGLFPLERMRPRALHYHFFTSYALILAARALTSLGDEPRVRLISTALGRTLKLLNSWTLFMGRTERWAPLCQWARDYAPLYPHVIPDPQTLQKCSTLRQINAANPLLPTDPHSGVLPFSDMMW
mmetsp:Transcript_26264/g.60713  ORF Transcript_26264/g.60713 Transcript_26264/m.60713 type:complete len:588 (-) Transcript_26264:108-1871(-)